jgi:hypothetical protein
MYIPPEKINCNNNDGDDDYNNNIYIKLSTMKVHGRHGGKTPHI